jgi:hypothetical protein
MAEEIMSIPSYFFRKERGKLKVDTSKRIK